MKNAREYLGCHYHLINGYIFMQLKHLIIFAVIGFVALLSFNVINGNRHETKRALAASPDISVALAASADNTNLSTNRLDTNNANNNAVTNPPLAEQPKAMMNKATTQIDDAELADEARLAQLDEK